MGRQRLRQLLMVLAARARAATTLQLLVLVAGLVALRLSLSGSGSGSERAAALQRLLATAAASGARVSERVRLEEVEPGGRGWGFVAVEALEPRAQVVELPLQLLVAPQDYEEEEGSPVFSLAKRLLRALKRSSRSENEYGEVGTAYASSLPWSRTPLEVLMPDLANAATKAYESLDEQDEWTLGEWLAAVLLVQTRAHVVSFPHGHENGGQQRLALVPIVDMFNAAETEANANVACGSVYSVVVGTGAEITMRCNTLRAVRPMEELLVTYRTRDGVEADKEARRGVWGIVAPL